MTVQASLTSGLLLCGTLYLSNGEAISRVVVAALMVVSSYFDAVVPGAGRWWRKMALPKFRAG